MSKKPSVDVDEDMMRKAMLDVPGMHNRIAAEAASPQGETAKAVAVVSTEPVGAGTEAKPATEPTSEPLKRGPYRKKRREEDELSYYDRFFVNDGVLARVTVAVDRKIHRKMKKILSVVAPEVSIVSYISNVLAHHLEQYVDEINALYRHETEKPL